MRWLAAILTASTCLLAAPATRAADSSQGNAIGFSADGHVFAFEQYGQEDGSGFPYSEIFIVDLDRDSWLSGTPIRVRIDNEEFTIGEARDKAMAQARPLLASARIVQPVEILASTPGTESVPDRHRLVFDRAYWSNYPEAGPAENRYELRLQDKEFPVPPSCPLEPEVTLKGFSLSMKETKSGAARDLYSDKDLPPSRGCALNYDIDSVIAPYDGTNAPYIVVMIGVYSLGFEGQDRRLIALPVKWD